ncbi:MAG: trypsin-like serine protease [Deltaproteobacteria bacterium]|nr:trypsin-like serine protease [Deltaproteobacteria bacterium]
MTSATSALGDRAVVAVVQRGGDLRCTGTLIAPRAVLTAAHCGVTADNAADFQVFVGEVVGGVGTGVDVASVRVHPGFVAATFASDLAVLWLRAEVPVVPVALPEGPLALEVGTAVRVVGYGVSVAGAADQGTRRQGSASISEVTEAEVTLAPAPSQPCSYDSGGPAFVTVRGVELLVGVTSRGDSACVTTSREVRVDAQLGFIRDALAAGPLPPPVDAGVVVPPDDDDGCTVSAGGRPARAVAPGTLLVLGLALLALAVGAARLRCRC